ncbi:MAG TPA: hypothetical protein VK622_00785, partial [Puia sp.]|nr:hypothetical protein [Puia sp.]
MIEEKSTSLPAGEELIEVFGARVHNLKNIDISIPKNQLVVITGISGSGKSSLAFDTIYAEGQRRYMESFGAYARQFIGDMERPDVDKITGLSPVISIEQKTTNRNPRSTVGTVTEVYDFLRLLYARIGQAFSYNTGRPMVKFSEEEIVTNIFQKFPNKKISVLSPLVRGRKGHYRELFEDIRKKGFVKVRVDGEIRDLVPKMQVDRYKIHDIEVVIDRLTVTAEMKTRVSQSVQTALNMGKGLMFLLINDDDKIVQYSKQLMCDETGISYEEPSPNSFSFNSPYGACPVCKGLGAVYRISLDAIIPDRKKSVNEGGIEPLGSERDAYTFTVVQKLARKNKFSLDAPIEDMPAKALNLILYGTTENTSEAILEIDESETANTNADYEGLIPMLKRWFGASSTDSLRLWVEKYMEL